MKIILDFGWVSKFFESTSFTGIATIFTAISAYLIYLRQKKEEKKQAAIILLNDIRSIEKARETLTVWISDERTISDSIQLYPINNWAKYSYLFVNDFEQNDFSTLNSFFTESERLQLNLNKNENLFWIIVEERAKVLQGGMMRIIEDIHKKNLIKLNDMKETNLLIDQARKEILEIYANQGYPFHPKKIVSDIKGYLDKVSLISITTIGSKLKDTATKPIFF